MVIAAPEFDTLAHARRLKDAGFDERQAEAAVAMVRHAVTEGVATKADIKVAVAELKTDIAANKADLKAAAAELKTDIAAVKWVLGFLAALNVAIVARLFGAF